MHYATFTDADGRKFVLTDPDPDDLMEKMANHVRGLFPDPSVLPRDADQVLEVLERDHRYLGTFSQSFEVKPSLWLFANLTGGATYSPQAVKVGSAEVDCENMQALGVGHGETPLDAWQDLLDAQPDLVEQGWENENIAAYPLAGAAEHNWK